MIKSDIPIIDVDRPIEDKSQDELSSSIYSSSLKDFIFQKDSLKIGIFGEYGSGKSSVINLLKKELRCGTKKTENIFHNISVWGYDSIGIMRKILTSLDKRFNLKLNLKEELYSEKESVHKKDIEKNIIYFLIISFVLIVILSVFPNIEKNAPEGLIVEIIGVGLFVFFGIVTLGRFRKTPPAKLDEFEEYWDKISKKLNKKKNLILIIDDLDRCESGTIKEILDKLDLIIKKINNFNVKIIIPLSIRNSHDSYASWEKFFDGFFWISSPGEMELYRMAKNNGKRI